MLFVCNMYNTINIFVKNYDNFVFFDFPFLTAFLKLFCFTAWRFFTNLNHIIKRRYFMNTQTIDAANNAVNTAPKNDTMGLIIYCLVIFAVIYLFMIRPNKKRMAEYQKMIDSLKVGNRVMAAGIYGTIKKIKEKTIDLEIAKGVVIEVNKNAVASVE